MSIIKTATQPSVNECTYCLKTSDVVEVTGQTRLAKVDKLVPFAICADCHKKLRSVCEATKIVEHRRKFWDKVHNNLKRQARKA